MSAIVTFAAVAVFGGSAAVAAGRRVLERRRARRELRARPPLEARTAEGTEVRATGIVRVLDSTLVAPLSGATCVVVRSRVRARGDYGAPRESFAMVPFVLDRGDGGGTVVIEGAHALLDLPPIASVSKSSKSFDEAKRREAFMVLHAIETRRRRGPARFEEIAVEPGMTVTVAGLMMKDIAEAPAIDQESGFRDDAPVAFRLAGNAEHPLVIGAPDAT